MPLARCARCFALALLLLGSTAVAQTPPPKLPVTGLVPQGLPATWTLRPAQGEQPTTDVLVRAGDGAELSVEVALAGSDCASVLSEAASAKGLVAAAEPAYLPAELAAGALEGPDGLASLAVACAATPRGALVLRVRYAGAFVDPDAEAARPVLAALHAAALVALPVEKPALPPGTFELARSGLRLDLAELGATLESTPDPQGDKLARLAGKGRALTVLVRKHPGACDAALDATADGLPKVDAFPPFVPSSYAGVRRRSVSDRTSVLACVPNAADAGQTSYTVRLEYEGPDRPGELRRLLEAVAQAAGHARHPVSFAPYEKRTGTWKSFGAYTPPERIKPRTGPRLEIGALQREQERGAFVSLDMLHASFEKKDDVLDGFWGFGGHVGYGLGGTLVADARAGAGGALRLGPFDFVLSVGLGSDFLRDGAGTVVNPALYLFYDFRLRIFFQRLVLEGSVLGAGRSVALGATDDLAVTNKEDRWGGRLVWLFDSGREISAGVTATVYDVSTVGNEPDPLVLSAVLGVTL